MERPQPSLVIENRLGVLNIGSLTTRVMWRTPSCNWDIASWGICRLGLTRVLTLCQTKGCIEREHGYKGLETIITVLHLAELRSNEGRWRWRTELFSKNRQPGLYIYLDDRFTVQVSQFQNTKAKISNLARSGPQSPRPYHR